MTDEMRRRAREMMDNSAETGREGVPLRGNFGSEPTPLASVPQPDPLAIDRETADRVLTMTFMSRTGGERPHVVTAGIDGSVWCICRASSPCWASKAFRRMTGRA